MGHCCATTANGVLFFYPNGMTNQTCRLCYLLDISVKKSIGIHSIFRSVFNKKKPTSFYKNHLHGWRGAHTQTHAYVRMYIV